MFNMASPREITWFHFTGCLGVPMKRIAGVLVAVALFTLSGKAQVTTGTITGTVSDNTGAVLPSAKVVILNEDTGISRSIQTDASGRFSAPSLSVGKYRVTASQDGFQNEARSGIDITVGLPRSWTSNSQ